MSGWADVRALEGADEVPDVEPLPALRQVPDAAALHETGRLEDLAVRAPARDGPPRRRDVQVVQRQLAGLRAGAHGGRGGAGPRARSACSRSRPRTVAR